MRINVKNLQLHPGRKENFHGVEKGRPEVLRGTGATFAQDIVIEVAAEYTGRAFLIAGHISTVLNLSCARCLRIFSFPIDTDLHITMAQTADHKIPDDEVIYFTGDEADISDSIDEALVLAVPLVPLCQKDCKGLCPICGNNNNLSACNCSDDYIDPRLEKLKYYK